MKTYPTTLLFSCSDEVKPCGVMTEHGAIWCRTVAELERKIRFVFDAEPVFADRRLTMLRSYSPSAVYHREHGI